MSKQDHLNHKPTAQGIELIEKLKSKIIELDEIINTVMVNGREKSLALTKLEECRMWAVKGIVFSNTESVNDIEGESNV